MQFIKNNLLQVLTIFVLLVAAFKNEWFYSQFHLDIFSYMGVSELLGSILKEGVTFLGVSILSIMPVLISSALMYLTKKTPNNEKRSWSGYYKSIFPNSTHLFIIVFVFVSIVVFWGGVENNKSSVKRNKYKGTTIFIKDKPMITINDTLRYLGKTEKYLFLYSTIETEPVILKMDDVEEIDFRVRK